MGEKKQARTTGAPPESGRKAYYVVNPGGAIHDCPREIASACLRQPGFRMATAAEIEELVRRSGHQTADNPICARWDPERDTPSRERAKEAGGDGL